MPASDESQSYHRRPRDDRLRRAEQASGRPHPPRSKIVRFRTVSDVRQLARIHAEADSGYAPAMHATREAIEQETERVRTVQDKQAPKYDRQISVFERILFGDGRAWVCSQARGKVLELAAGTNRNLPFYPRGTQLTTVELSSQMLSIGRKRALDLGHPADLLLG